jgi:hypothetical protein
MRKIAIDVMQAIEVRERVSLRLKENERAAAIAANLEDT